MEEILESGDVVVGACDDDDVVIVWNHSATFNVWVRDTNNYLDSIHYKNIDCFTVYNQTGVESARKCALQYLDGVYG